MRSNCLNWKANFGR